MVTKNLTPRQVEIEKLRTDTQPTSALNKALVSTLKHRMTSNYNPLYANSEKDKDLILHHLRQRYLKVRSKKDVINTGDKNLLYFSIFNDAEYIDLLYICLKSIVERTPDIQFDTLFITNDSTKKKIESFDIISKFKVDYLIYENVLSGPPASLQKLNIFDYKKISEYSKILFFDADIICINDLNIIFDEYLEHETLYVCSPPAYKSCTLLSPTHGIMYLSNYDAEFLYDNPKIVPFNAGQFLFLNSSRMKEHFENVRWLKDSWPCEYFYEQSFMNYYFVIRNLTKPMYTPLGQFSEQKHQAVSIVHDNIESGPTDLLTPTKIHNDQTVAIHFAAVGENKKTYINFYTNAYKLHV